MTFSQIVKDELLVKDIDPISAKFELVAIFKAIGTINQEHDSMQIEIKTTQIKLARRIITIVNHEYSEAETQTIVRTTNKFKKKSKNYIIRIVRHAKEILLDLKMIDSLDINFIFKFKEITLSKLTESITRAYTMDFFCACGSINDPRKSGQYHLEIVNSNESYLNEIKKMLKKFDINFRLTKRKRSSSLYLNKAEEIADFLKYVQAIDSLLEFEGYRMTRDMKIVNNRLNNADIANETKKVGATQKHIRAIDYLKNQDMYKLLSEKTKVVAELRIEYPDDSLNELSKRTDGKISKSNISHHLQLISKRAEHDV